MSLELIALIVRVTLTTSIAILIVVALRKPLRETFGASIAYAFWLLVPTSLFANFLPARRIAVFDSTPADGASPTVAGVLGGQNAGFPPTGTDSATAMLSTWQPASWLALVWFSGFLLSLALLVYRQRRFLKMHGLNRIRGRYCVAPREGIGPVIVAVVRPRIVLPRDFVQRYDTVERQLILEHEQAHIRSGDVLVNAFAALTQCLLWFNPLVHLALPRLRVDQELACDARVMRKHAKHRRAYAEALLKTQMAARAVPLGCAWPPGGTQSLRQRITQLGHSRPARSRWTLGALLCVLSAVTTAAVAWAAIPPEAAPREIGPASNARTQVDTLARALGDALVTALKERKTDHARALIEAGADVNHYRRGDGTPLTVAAQQGDDASSVLLINAGANVNLAAPGDGNPLIVAAGRGDYSLVEFFVDNGADVNAYVRGDETPLINAAARNRMDVARFLIERGADVNLAVDSGNGYLATKLRSPLGQARRFGHDRMASLLVEHGAVSTDDEE